MGTETTATAVMIGTTGTEIVTETVIEIGTVIATGIVTETATGIEIAGAQIRGLGRARAIGEMTAEDVMTEEGPGTMTRMTRMTGIGTETGTRIEEPLTMALGALQKVLLQGARQSSHGKEARSNGLEGSSHTRRHIPNHMTSRMDKLLVNGMHSSQLLAFQHGILSSNGLGHHQLLPRDSGRRR